MIKLEENNIASGENISKFTTHHISRYADLFLSDIAVITVLGRLSTPNITGTRTGFVNVVRKFKLEKDATAKMFHNGWFYPGGVGKILARVC